VVYLGGLQFGSGTRDAGSLTVVSGAGDPAVSRNALAARAAAAAAKAAATTKATW
jgi:hypothetical protein